MVQNERGVCRDQPRWWTREGNFLEAVVQSNKEEAVVKSWNNKVKVQPRGCVELDTQTHCLNLLEMLAFFHSQQPASVRKRNLLSLRWGVMSLRCSQKIFASYFRSLKSGIQASHLHPISTINSLILMK